ncbi:arginine-hydroxylase NDUFAF5, mitochondrial isoform X2 [Frankliniella occidentalis]|uniref:Arginine-hydroxylase NDUFAF5, mitochondrial n=1 Tax=Frankliniella occidentalis TaxID=133901 RepID=A0A6J1SB22_FRAOC|nr:arginine-hydroxylase NDUFAF5, mitochondrial isoform X2 [Frankliniella occidentalis]
MKLLRSIVAKQSCLSKKTAFLTSSSGLCNDQRCHYSGSVRNAPEENVMNIFDRNAKRIQKERAAMDPDVAVYDYLKEEVGFRLSERILDIKRKFGKVVDLGCGRGYVSRHILSSSVEELVMCDLSPTHLKQATGPEEAVKCQRLVVDEENLPFEPNSIDMFVSNLSLHWVNDLPGTFAQINRCLKNDGCFLASVFGGDTLFELRCSLQMAELERQGGLAAHISPFAEVRDIGGLLQRAQFTMLTIDTDEIVINYPSMFEVMWDLKGMGESNAARNRKLSLPRETLMAAAAIYETIYGNNNGRDGTRAVPASFQVYYLLGWKPDPSQPKPKARGTGQVSLKDIHKLDEIMKKHGEIEIGDGGKEK